MTDILALVKAKNPAEPEFHQAVEEVLESLDLVVQRRPDLAKAKILERIVEPERVIMFRVPWQDDRGEVHINRGFRVQMNGALGPYKGGLRFHHSVTLGVLKFLAFEQVFKNSLTTLAMGGGKGGSDFHPHGRSDNEVMRFCQSFMTELMRHIGPDTDVPAGDIGVGGREIGYLFGQYRRLRNEFTGVLTGKGLNWGGSLIRPEATGYGAVYFTAEMLATRNETLEGKVCLVSGSGNVAQYTIEKLIDLGAKAVTVSDSDGYVYDEAGFDREKLAFLMELKNVRRGRVREYADRFKNIVYTRCRCGSRLQPAVDAPGALRIPERDTERSQREGCRPPRQQRRRRRGRRGEHAVHHRGGTGADRRRRSLRAGEGCQRRRRGHLGPGDGAEQRAAVVVTRTSGRGALHGIMKSIHRACRETSDAHGVSGNYVHGANIAGFTKVADAMLDQGLI